MEPTLDVLEVKMNQLVATTKLVNVTAVSPALEFSENFAAPGGVVRVPRPSVAQPWTREVPAKYGEFMLHAAGYGARGGIRGWRGLRPWLSPTAVPENDHDRETIEMIKQQDRVLDEGEAPPQFSERAVRPYMPGAQQSPGVERSESVPQPAWTRAKLDDYIVVNGMQQPRAKTLEAAIEEIASAARQMIARGIALRPPRTSRLASAQYQGKARPKSVPVTPSSTPPNAA